MWGGGSLGDPSDFDNVEPSLSHHSPAPRFTSTPENAALGEGARVNGGKVKKLRAGIASIRLFVDPRGCMLGGPLPLLFIASGAGRPVGESDGESDGADFWGGDQCGVGGG
jgi:hypothetical protein